MKKILVVNNAEPCITEFVEPIAEIVIEEGFKPVCIEYKDSKVFNFKRISGAILSGSPLGNDIVEHHLPFFTWIKAFSAPVFGICAGHHIAGFMYGAKLLRSQEPESGDFEIQVVKKDPLFYELPEILRVKQMHNDSITLPETFEILATSKTCRNQLMKHKERPLYTCQFHPEFYNHDIIRNFLKMCK